MLSLPSPEEIDARRQAMLKPHTFKGVGVGAGRGAGGAKYVDVGGFMVPTSSPEVIEGRSTEANKQLAEGLRGMLEVSFFSPAMNRAENIRRRRPLN
jgi:hypothetical protein